MYGYPWSFMHGRKSDLMKCNEICFTKKEIFSKICALKSGFKILLNCHFSLKNLPKQEIFKNTIGD